MRQYYLTVEYTCSCGNRTVTRSQVPGPNTDAQSIIPRCILCNRYICGNYSFRTTQGNALFQIIFYEFRVLFWIYFMKIPLPRENDLYNNPDLALDVFNEASFTVGSRPK